MIDVTPGLAELFDSGAPLLKCDLYTFTLSAGHCVRYTDHDVSITYGGFTFQPGPAISRTAVHSSVGIDVDDMEIQVSAESRIQINGVSLMQFISRGGMDNGRVLVEKAFWAVGEVVPRGTVFVFAGRIADVSGSRYEKALSIKSDTEVLNVMVPRDVYQPSCKNSVFDGPCGLVRSAWGVAGSATADGDTRGTKLYHALSQSEGWFDRGRITFTSGANSGISRSIRRHTSGEIEFLQALPYPVLQNASFLVYPGCDRRLATCESKFNNRLKFRGEPWVPTPETVT